MATKRKKTGVTFQSLSELGETVRKIGEKYLEIAETMKTLQLTAIEVTGKPSAEKGLGLIRGWLRTLREAIDDAELGGISQASQELAVEIAGDIEQKDAKRKGKK